MKTRDINAIHPGMYVIIKHDQGLEIGRVDSINFATGKILIFFNYESCPHFALFNIEQVQEFYSSLGSPKC